MLRPKKFRPFETAILWGFALLLLGGGVIGVFLSWQRANLKLALASVGLLVLATVYLASAGRGKPL